MTRKMNYLIASDTLKYRVTRYLPSNRFGTKGVSPSLTTEEGQKQTQPKNPTNLTCIVILQLMSAEVIEQDCGAIDDAEDGERARKRSEDHKPCPQSPLREVILFIIVEDDRGVRVRGSRFNDSMGSQRRRFLRNYRIA